MASERLVRGDAVLAVRVAAKPERARPADPTAATAALSPVPPPPELSLRPPSSWLARRR